jgi:hypothetical protein
MKKTNSPITRFNIGVSSDLGIGWIRKKEVKHSDNRK